MRGVYILLKTVMITSSKTIQRSPFNNTSSFWTFNKSFWTFNKASITFNKTVQYALLNVPNELMKVQFFLLNGERCNNKEISDLKQTTYQQYANIPLSTYYKIFIYF